MVGILVAEQQKKKGKILVVALFLAFVFIMAFQGGSVAAGVPHDIDIYPWKNGTHTILNITITHDGGAPTSTHYVDLVQVFVSGETGFAIHDMNYTSSQSTVAFVAQYDMGVITGTPAVQARARCTLDGWSIGSKPLEIPEFSSITLILVLVVVAITLFFVRSRIRLHKSI